MVLLLLMLLLLHVARFQETGLGLWRGSVPRMLSFAALASIQFTVYEQVMQAIDERQRY